MKKEEKEFSLKPLDDDKKDSVESKVDSLVDTKLLDESNPLERAAKFAEVKKNPPSPGYMKVDLHKGKKPDGESVIISKSVDSEGNETVFEEDPFFTIDLKTLIDSDVAACPSNTIPMLINQAVRLAVDEKKAFKPEKRKDEFNYWWIVFALLPIPAIILIVIAFLGGG